MIARAVVFLSGLGLAVALAFLAQARGAGPVGILVVAAIPLVVLSLPAGLLAWATVRRGDPYNVEREYR